MRGTLENLYFSILHPMMPRSPISRVTNSFVHAVMLYKIIEEALI
jgi:hypothetical protein